MIPSKLTLILSLLFLNICCSTLLPAQVFINREWVQTIGAPSEIAWSASIMDTSGNIFIAGNTSTATEKVNMLITKLDQNGQVIWETQYNHSANDNDYGTAITLDNFGNVYVAGTSYIPLQNSYDYTILKYTPTGTLSWAYHYNHISNGNDIPSAISTDTYGNVYVTGGSESTTTAIDYCTIKIDPLGSLVWERRYDHNNFFDIPGALTIDNNSNVVVTGGSGTSLTSGDFATLKYTPTGNLVSESRIAANGISIEHPSVLAKDLLGNLYISGKANNDIMTMKLDQDLNLIWTNTYDGFGYEDEPISIKVTDGGHVYIAGHTSKSNGATELLVLKINDLGVLAWDRKTPPLDGGGSAKATKLFIDNFGDMYVVGQMHNNNQDDIYLAKYDALGTLQWHIYEDPLTGLKDEGLDVFANVSNEVFVIGRSINTLSESSQYVNIKYSLFKREQPIVEEPFGRFENEFLIRFNTEVLLTPIIDNQSITFGTLSDFITPKALDSLSERLKIEALGRLRTYKVFPRITTADSISIARATKRSIKMPTFWATLGIIFPEGTNDTMVLQELNAFTDIIEVASCNHVCYTLNTNDPSYISGNQPNLRSTSTFPNANINIESAWEIAEDTDQASIKVGVYDSGINWQHEEFGDGTFANSKIDGGYDYFDGSELSMSTPEDENGHGTAVAGIIGAIRNNEKGIAGIAGGNAGNGNTGATLFDMRILGPDGTGSTNIAVNAIVEGAMDSPTGSGFGLHVMNHSWETSRNQELKDANRFAFENEVAFIAGSGNAETEPTDCIFVSYPSTYNDSWNMKIGANNGTGLRAPFSNCGYGLDFIAPGTNDIVLTTGINSNFDYVPFSGTSAATPHTTGATSLLLSYINNHPNAANNIVPEDAEQLMQLYCTNVSNPLMDYEDHTGFGRLNIGETFDHITLPGYQVLHFQTSTPIWDTAILDGSCEKTVINTNVDDFVGLPSNTYRVDRYKVTVTHNFNIGDYEIVDAWVRNSASNLFPILSSPSLSEAPRFLNEVGIQIESYTNSSITLSGYLYHFYAFPFCDEALDIWQPFDLNEIAEFAYSLYVKDPVLTNVKNMPGNEFEISVFPNPIHEEFTLEIQSPARAIIDVTLFDAKGTRTKKLCSNYHCSSNTTILNFNTSDINAGVYFLEVKSDQFISTTKLIIQK